jgi:hypothetical protein
MFETWLRTVFSEIERERAICLLPLPRAKDVMICSFRSVRISTVVFHRAIRGSCTGSTIIRFMKDKRRAVRVTRLHERDGGTDFENTTPAERLSMMWQLAIDVWAFKGEPVAEPRLPRHVVRVVRGRR